MEKLNYLNTVAVDEKTLVDERSFYKKYHDNKCFYCGKVIKDFDNKTVDHMIPISRGGIDAPSNYCIACKSCNLEKSNMTPFEYDRYKKVTANWKKNLKVAARDYIVEKIKKNEEIDWDNIVEENMVEMIDQEIDIKKIILTPIDLANQKKIKLSNKKVQDTLIDYTNGIITPLKVFRTKVFKDYILLNKCTKYYVYKNVLKFKNVKIECIDVSELSKNNVLNILTCVQNNLEREELLNRLQEITDNEEALQSRPYVEDSKSHIEQSTQCEYSKEIDINLIKIPTMLRHNLKQITSDNRKVKNLIEEYENFGTIRPIKTFRYIPLNNLYVYYAYKFILKLSKIKIEETDIEDLNKKERSFIMSCNF